MCINKIFYRFGNKNENALLAVTHNSKESLEITEYLLKNYNFKKFLIELNKANAYFIIKNNFFPSEFHPLLKKFNEKSNFENSHNKIMLIDTSIEAEIKIFSRIKRNFNREFKYNFYHEHISYRLAKHVFYKLWHFGEFKAMDSVFDFNEAIKKMDFYQSHILYREFTFLIKIKREMHLSLNENKEEYIRKYFGKNYDPFLQEANENNNVDKVLDSVIPDNNKENLLDEKIEADKNKHKSNSTKNEILVVIGQYHFDNIIKNNLL